MIIVVHWIAIVIFDFIFLIFQSLSKYGILLNCGNLQLDFGILLKEPGFLLLLSIYFNALIFCRSSGYRIRRRRPSVDSGGPRLYSAVYVR